MLSTAEKGGTFLLASHFGKDEVWEHLPVEVPKQLIDKSLNFYVIDALKIAEKVGLGGRINTIMQTAFFLISGVLPEERAVKLIGNAVEDTYGNKGQDIVEMNMRAVEASRNAIEQVDYPKQTKGDIHMIPLAPEAMPQVPICTVTFTLRSPALREVSALTLSLIFFKSSILIFAIAALHVLNLRLPIVMKS